MYANISRNMLQNAIARMHCYAISRHERGLELTRNNNVCFQGVQRLPTAIDCNVLWYIFRSLQTDKSLSAPNSDYSKNSDLVCILGTNKQTAMRIGLSPHGDSCAAVERALEYWSNANMWFGRWRTEQNTVVEKQFTAPIAGIKRVGLTTLVRIEGSWIPQIMHPDLAASVPLPLSNKYLVHNATCLLLASSNKKNAQVHNLGNYPIRAFMRRIGANTGFGQVHIEEVLQQVKVWYRKHHGALVWRYSSELATASHVLLACTPAVVQEALHIPYRLPHTAAILRLLHDGCTVRTITEQLNCTAGPVYTIKKEYDAIYGTYGTQ